jgi:hypothetical protein
MKLSDFRIGSEFLFSEGRYRCTDIGTRVVVAIRIDRVQKATSGPGEKPVITVLDQAAAEAEGWFSGPPYGVLESVLDEYDLEGCEPVNGEGG